MAKSKAEATVVALDADPLAHAVRALLDEHEGRWSGTPTALLNVVRANADRDTKGDLPRAANVLTNRLQRLAPTLRDVGIDVTLTRTASSRSIELARREGPSSSSSVVMAAKERGDVLADGASSTVTERKLHRHDGQTLREDEASKRPRHHLREASRENDGDDDDDDGLRSSSSSSSSSSSFAASAARAAVEAG
jgi:hypothetical protein